MFWRHQAIIASGVSAASGVGTTNAMPTSPMRWSGIPITATWAISPWPNIRFSISAG
jgi:hypothetical protein